MDRVTPDEVDRAFGRWIECLKGFKLIERDAVYVLEHGSPSNGKPWKWFQDHPNGGLSEPPIGPSLLGWTAREAFDSLLDWTTVVYDVHHALHHD